MIIVTLVLNVGIKSIIHNPSLHGQRGSGGLCEALSQQGGRPWRQDWGGINWGWIYKCVKHGEKSKMQWWAIVLLIIRLVGLPWCWQLRTTEKKWSGALLVIMKKSLVIILNWLKLVRYHDTRLFYFWYFVFQTSSFQGSPSQTYQLWWTHGRGDFKTQTR